MARQSVCYGTVKANVAFDAQGVICVLIRYFKAYVVDCARKR